MIRSTIPANTKTNSCKGQTKLQTVPNAKKKVFFEVAREERDVPMAEEVKASP